MGFVAAALYLFLSHVASWKSFVPGLLIALAGLLLRGWAAGYLDKGKRLAQDGPYGYIRHPLYAGSFLLALGFCVMGTDPDYPIHVFLLWGVFLALFCGVYPKRIREEESSLERYFGDAWRSFTARNRRFLPRLTPVRSEKPDVFLWSRYRKNREYNAFVGWLAGVSIVAAKWLISG